MGLEDHCYTDPADPRTEAGRKDSAAVAAHTGSAEPGSPAEAVVAADHTQGYIAAAEPAEGLVGNFEWPAEQRTECSAAEVSRKVDGKERLG